VGKKKRKEKEVKRTDRSASNESEGANEIFGIEPRPFGPSS